MPVFNLRCNSPKCKFYNRKVPDFSISLPDNVCIFPDNTLFLPDFWLYQADNIPYEPDRGIRTFNLKSPCPAEENLKHYRRQSRSARLIPLLPPPDGEPHYQQWQIWNKIPGLILSSIKVILSACQICCQKKKWNICCYYPLYRQEDLPKEKSQITPCDTLISNAKNQVKKSL